MKRRSHAAPELAETVAAGPLDLVPLGYIAAFGMHRELMKRDHLRTTLFQIAERPGLWKAWRKYRAPNGRSRFAHAIRLRESGETVGWHFITLMPYKSAHLTIAMFREDEETRGMAFAARQALILHFRDHGDIERFTGHCDIRNFASVLLYKKLGFRESGIMNHAGYDPVRGRVIRRFLFDLMGDGLARFGEHDRA